jgi:hypothetical protein
MKQYRVVYEYKKDQLRGAGACFVSAESEEAARSHVGEAMPGVAILRLTEEPEDLLAAYERRPRLAVVR